MKPFSSDSLAALGKKARSLDPKQGASFAIEEMANKSLSNPNKPLAIAGVDEAGRGPLAGPVVAAAVVLDRDNTPQGLADSKALSHKKRELLFDEILQNADVGWCSIAANQIDEINILQASLLAMTKAVAALNLKPDLVLVDGRDVPQKLTGRGVAIIKGDALSLSIAAASIIAKVVRDRMMEQADSFNPQYGFSSHKGYGTKQHLEAIAIHGPCPLHRMSFSPLRQDRLL